MMETWEIELRHRLKKEVTSETITLNYGELWMNIPSKVVTKNEYIEIEVYWEKHRIKNEVNRDINNLIESL